MVRPVVPTLSFVVACSFAVADLAQGQVKNSDFSERGREDHDWPVGWIAAKEDKGSLYRLVDDDGHSGNDCLRYQCRETRRGGAVAQVVTCKANTQYTLGVWLKSDGTLRPAVLVTPEEEPDRELARAVGDKVNQWRHKSVTFNSGATTRLRVLVYGDVTIRDSGQAPSGFSAFDDVELVEATAAAINKADPVKWAAPGPNVALGRPSTFSRNPNYGLCTDVDDKTQLTDGAYSVGYFWTQKQAVGWSSAETYPVAITIDLGTVEPICGVSYSTAAGVAEVHWPRALYLMTSDDGIKWFLAGDLVLLDATRAEPPAPGTYSNHQYATDRLKTRGRFVALLVDSDHYVFCDEIEVYRAGGVLPDRPQGKPVGAPLDYYWRGMRLEADLDTIANRLKKSRLSASDRTKAQHELEELRSQTAEPFPPLPKETPAILPLNDLQSRIFALNGASLKGLGLPALFAWKKNRYDPLSPIEVPESVGKAPPSLNLHMMNNEERGDAIILTNASPKDVQLRLRITGLPGGNNPDYLSLRDIPFVDSAPRVDVACALPEAKRQGQDYVVTIPAGMNRQIWLAAHPVRVASGTYNGSVQVLKEKEGVLKVPIRLRISSIRFPDRPRLHVGGWDYTDAEETYDIVRTNRDLVVEYLKRRYVDSPWGGGGVLPGAGPEAFDAQGQLVKELDFRRLDDWISRWKGARRFLIFLNAQPEFAGAKMGTPTFEARVALWTSAIGQHVNGLGVRPEQLGLLIYDEPNNEDQAAIIRGWADAIHRGGSGILVWEDPHFQEPQSESFHNTLAACDVVCPIVGLYLTHDEPKRQVYRDLTRNSNRKLWFYNASGPVRALDPYAYYRLQHWLCFREGAEGSCFWAFGDAGGGSSWNERSADRGSGYAPQYLTKDTVTDSKHIMALVEGVQDYEYLSMLRDRVQELEGKGIRTPTLAAARALLADAPKQVLADIDASPDLTWKKRRDRSVADRMCEKVLNALGALK
ncbi:MAG: hypothetical protein HY318_05325 [Armatimonadetes bacterium]|nr:hypothetical protein [Armatimonadota bacterium]